MSRCNVLNRPIQLSISIIIIALLTSCTEEHLRTQHAFCDPPDAIEHSDMIGNWSLLYSDRYFSNYYVDPATNDLAETTYPLNGQEFLRFLADGTYEHEFELGDYAYKSLSQKWTIDNQALDGPKLKLENYIYFAAGVSLALSSNTIVLEPQLPEQFKIQEYEGGTWGNGLNGLVTYPIDGHVSLYPRYCRGQFVLQQMVLGIQDPDDMSIRNPVFVRE